MKKFTTYEEQIEILKNRTLTITSEQDLLNKLEDCGYYNLINGYSFLFKHENNNIYKDKVTDEDIINLYNFDKNLRTIVYKYTLNIESRLKSQISYQFSSKYGELESNYLQEINFDKDPNKKESITKLLETCKNIISAGADKKNKKFRSYIYHYVNEHGHVPLWVLIRAMTLGEVSIFFANMKLEDKTQIAKKYSLTASNMQVMFKILVSFRNIVAHDERIFYAQIKKDRLPYNLEVYNVMRIKKNHKGVPFVGKNDFLSLMIIFKYFLKPLEFASFWEEFESERIQLTNKLKPHFIAQINDSMGLKNRWRNLKNYKIT